MALDITPRFAGALVVEGSGVILQAELDLQVGGNEFLLTAQALATLDRALDRHHSNAS